MFIARGPRSRARLLGVVLALVLLPFGVPLLAPAAPAHADFTALCTGYVGCKQAGYGNAGYQRAGGRMYWRMYAGHNCTNYAAYRMVKAGMPNTRPWSGGGNAENWGKAMAFLTDQTPTVGAVAWFDAYDGYAGSAGHVAYVERVVSDSEIIVSEDMWGGDFHWRRLTTSGRGWPTGFIHFRDVTLSSKQPPSIVGTPQVGETLTAQPGSWSARPERYRYQWFADGQSLPKQTAATFTPGAGRVGQQITVQVSATADGYATATATSAATAAVSPGVISPVSQPTVTGPAELGATLTATKGQWDPGKARTTVQWRADGAPIPGATGWTLALGPDEVGTKVSAVVTATRKGYAPAEAATPATPSVLGGEVKVTQPFVLDGTAADDAPPVVGRELRVQPGVVDPADATASYTWLRDGEAIAGAEGPAYVPEAADVGARLSVRVDLRRDGYQPTSRTTAATAPVHTVPQLQVVSTGKRQKARVVIDVTAPGLDDVTGTVSVRVGKVRRTVQLRDGHRRVVAKGLHAGTKKVVVRYLGAELADPTSYRGTVDVLAKKRRTDTSQEREDRAGSTSGPRPVAAADEAPAA